MSISIQCPACQAKLSAPDTSAGKRVKCPKCQGAIAIPGAVPAMAAAPPAAPRPAANPAAAQARSPQPESARAVKPAAASTPVASAPQVALPVASAPVPASAPPVAAPANSDLPVMLIVLGIAILGGSVLLVSAIGIGAYVLMASGEPAGPPAGPVAALAGGPPAPPPIAAPPAPAPTAVQAAPQPPAAASVNWVAYENVDKGFRAAFPGGQPQPLDPLAEIQDESQRELAAAMMKEWTVLGITHAGRKYTLTAAPLNLGGVPPEVYLDRMSAGLGLIHQGFSLDPQPPADRSAPIRDYVLKKDDAGKLLRVVVGGGHVYQLLIEGEAGLTFTDLAAKEFFERFECIDLTGAAVAAADSSPDDLNSKSQTKGRSGEPPQAAGELDGIDWQPFTGQKIAFTINFPGVTPEQDDPLAGISAEERQFHEQAWAKDGVVVESFMAQAGDRQYRVIAFRDPNLRELGRIPFNAEMDRRLNAYIQDIYQEARRRGRSLRGESPAVKWQQWTTATQVTNDAKYIVRTAQLGHYGFVVHVMGPTTMEDLDPLAHRFINSLEPPVGTEPLPLNVKPLPGPGGQPKSNTKTKKKSK